MIRDSRIETSEDFIFDGSYEIIAPVGRGRNSVVYKARQILPAAKRSSSEFLALKVLIGNAKNPGLQVRRMKREALAMLSSIGRNVIKLFNYVAQEDLCYLAMEFAERGDLKLVLEQQKNPFSSELALRLTSQILLGLERIHRVGLVHRDIKPENLLLTGDCLVKIADFGIACLPTESVTAEEANRGIGTFDYLAPESLEEGISNEATDVYSVAVTSYQLLTSHLPFAGTSFTDQIANKLESKIIPLDYYLKSVPHGLQQLVQKSLNSDVERRFKTASEYRQAIEEFLAGSWQPDTVPAKPSTRTVSEVKQKASKEYRRQKPSSTFECAGEVVKKQGGAVVTRELGGKIAQLAEASWPIVKERLQVIDDILRHATPRQLVVGVVAMLFVLGLLAKGLSGTVVSPTRGHAAASGLDEARRSKKLLSSEFGSLFDREHAGIIYNLLGDNNNLPIVAVPSASKKELVLILGLAGWQPVVLSMADFAQEKEVRFSGSGLQFSLQLSSDSKPEGQIIGGTYHENRTGRDGTWTIW